MLRLHAEQRMNVPHIAQLIRAKSVQFVLDWFATSVLLISAWGPSAIITGKPKGKVVKLKG